MHPDLKDSRYKLSVVGDLASQNSKLVIRNHILLSLAFNFPTLIKPLAIKISTFCLVKSVFIPKYQNKF